MKTKIEDYVRLIVDITTDASGSVLDGQIGNVLRLMRERGDEHLIPRLSGALEMALDNRGGGAVYVTMAREDDELKKRIAASLNRREEEVKVHIDESIIGGAHVRVGNTVVDGSVKGQFARLKAHLAL